MNKEDPSRQVPGGGSFLLQIKSRGDWNKERVFRSQGESGDVGAGVGVDSVL